MRVRHGVRWPVLAMVALAVSAGPTRAATVDATPVSPEAALTGNAAVASDDPGGGGWYNPASLAVVTRSQVSVGASAYSLANYDIRGAMVSQLPWATLSGDLKDTRYVSVPSVVSYTYGLQPGLGISIGVWTPVHTAVTGSTVMSSSGPVPGRPDLTASFTAYYSTYQASDETWGGIAVGWQATPRLRVGGALQGLYATGSSSIDLSSSLQTDSTVPNEDGGLIQVMVRSDESVIGFRAMGGVQWDATPSLRLALAARTATVRLAAWGSATRITSLATLLPGQPPDQQQYLERVVPDEGVSVRDPPQLIGGLSWRSGPLDLRLEGDWQPALRRQWASQRETWNLRTAGTWVLGEDLTAGLGIFREQGPGVAAKGSYQLTSYGFAAGIDVRPARVVKALGGGKAWDMRTTLAVRGTYGTGKAPGLLIVPFDPKQSILPFLPTQNSDYLEVPVRSFEGALSLFTTISF
jgi:hypothetical protein